MRNSVTAGLRLGIVGRSRGWRFVRRLGGDADRHAARALESAEALLRVYTRANADPVGGRLRFLEGGRRVAVDVVMGLEVDGAAPHAHLDRLVGEFPRYSDRDEREEPLDVLGIEPDAAVAHLHTDAPGD